jgi:hypothetical protein
VCVCVCVCVATDVIRSNNAAYHWWQGPTSTDVTVWLAGSEFAFTHIGHPALQRCHKRRVRVNKLWSFSTSLPPLGNNWWFRVYKFALNDIRPKTHRLCWWYFSNVYDRPLFVLNNFDMFLNFTEKSCQMFENAWFVKYFVFEVFSSVSGKLRSSQMWRNVFWFLWRLTQKFSPKI